MPGPLTEITEIATALGTLAPTLDAALAHRPTELRHVSDDAWAKLVAAAADGRYAASFETAFANGRAFLAASDALRGRRPSRVEWKGPHRPPGDDVIPADLRIDHVYLVSCKYLSKVLLNAGPQRLFERLLVGEQRSAVNWFVECAPAELQDLYEHAIRSCGLDGLPDAVTDLDAAQQQVVRRALSARALPPALVEPWDRLCQAVSWESARRWNEAASTPNERLRLLWRMLRISGSTYFVLGTDATEHLRLRVDSTWDWMQAFELRTLAIAPRPVGQPEVSWQATIRDRVSGADTVVDGHVEVRWSHGRFVGSPEAKVYLDTPHADVPGYHPLR